MKIKQLTAMVVVCLFCSSVSAKTPDFTSEINALTGHLNTTLHQQMSAREGSFLGDDGFFTRTDMHNKTYANSIYGVYKQTFNENWQGGAALSVSYLKNDYKDDARKHQTVAHAFFPIVWKNDSVKITTIPFAGYAFGKYKNADKSVKADVDEYLYGVTNETKYVFDWRGVTMEPMLIFSVLGVHQKKIDTANLKEKSKYDTAVNGGLGFYARKNFILSANSRIQLYGGGSYHHALNYTKSQRDKGVLSIKTTYDYKQLSLYGQLFQWVKSDSQTMLNIGVSLNF